jgi:hypothetical protein
MRCLACGAEMRLSQVVKDTTMFVPGYEHRTWQCSGCSTIERRMTFTHEKTPTQWVPAEPTQTVPVEPSQTAGRYTPDECAVREAPQPQGAGTGREVSRQIEVRVCDECLYYRTTARRSIGNCNWSARDALHGVRR